MSSRNDTLADRVERAQREIETWNSRERATMQLQGATDAEGLTQSRVGHEAVRAPSGESVASQQASPLRSQC